jgi:hypothetical protein
LELDAKSPLKGSLLRANLQPAVARGIVATDAPIDQSFRGGGSAATI